jgi:hypothetical protein
MSKPQLTTPVALFIFNRPDATRQVFLTIKHARPMKLFVIADGPRANVPEENELCRQARSIIKEIDWSCELDTFFSDENLGCRRRISSGLDWVFGEVEEAIILEDDCIPHQSFFTFCEELLKKYRHDERIAQISGSNYQFGHNRTTHSYYYSRYNHIWGWASWRRSWRLFDVDMKLWPKVKRGRWLKDILGDETMARYWESNFDKVYNQEIDTWDFQWTFTCWINNQLSILPHCNLVTNIGFSNDATHTTDVSSMLANMPCEEMVFPLSHPTLFIRDSVADSKTEKILYRSGNLKDLCRRLASLGRLG